jgi:lipopolysaccharide export system permease protein
MVKKIDWYIIKKFWGSFVFIIMIMAIIASVIDYTEKVKHFVSKKVPTLEILGYFQNFIPHIIALLFALFIFIATIYFTSKLAYKSEIIAILASGASFNRFLRPYFIGGWVICLIFMGLNHWVVPNSNKKRLAFERKYIHNKITYSDRNVHLRLSPNLYVYVQNYDYTTNSGFRFTSEVIDGLLLKERITADRISYDSAKKVWHLFNVVKRTNDGLNETLEQIPELEQTYAFVPKDLYEDEDVKETLTTPELNAFIAQEELRGRESLNMYYIEKYRRTAQPVAGFILCIIGVCIASKKVRGGSGLHLAIGILVSAIYMLMLQFSNTFSMKADLNPFIAVWIPNVIFSIVALVMYKKQVT